MKQLRKIKVAENATRQETCQALAGLLADQLEDNDPAVGWEILDDLIWTAGSKQAAAGYVLQAVAAWADWDDDTRQ